MNFLYAVKVLVITKEEEKRAEGLSSWHVEPGHALLSGILEESKKAKGDQHRIIISIDNQQALGAVEKALAHFEKKLNVDRENMLIMEMNYLGEGAL